MTTKVLIIDYKVGNHQSIANALKFLGYEFSVSSDKKEIEKASSYILPGVGAFDEAMKNLKELDLIDELRRQVIENKKPLLGICLGMQVLATKSEEGGLYEGLNFIPGKIVKFKDESLSIPHVGWNEVNIKIKDPLFTRIKKDANFYFDHSYHFTCDKQYIAATSLYGAPVVAAVARDNIFGTQFHPEKSQINGLRIFRSFFNFVEQGNVKK